MSEPIQHTSERLLEFDHLRELLSVYAASPLGQGRIAALKPSQDRAWIERQHQLARELRGFLQAGGRFDFHGRLDPTQLILKSRIRGAALELTEVPTSWRWPTARLSGARPPCIRRQPSSRSGKPSQSFPVR
jgi:hypothetical protein